MRRRATVALTAILLVAACGPTSVVPLPSPPPSPTATPTASPTPTPTSTPSPTPAGAPRFRSFALGYEIELVAPWRQSGCLSSDGRGGAVGAPVADVFTFVPEEEEQYGDTGGTQGTLSVVRTRNEQNLSPEQWAATRTGTAAGQRVEIAQFEGRLAARLTRGAQYTEALFYPDRGDMVAVGYASGSPNDPALQRMFLSYRSIPAGTASPSPSPTPEPRTVEAVADALATGFGARDVTALRALLGSCVILGMEQAGAGSHAPARFERQLREWFAAGVMVQVTPRPIEQDTGPFINASYVRTLWRQPGQADARVDLLIRVRDGRAFWAGTLRRQP